MLALSPILVLVFLIAGLPASPLLAASANGGPILSHSPKSPRSGQPVTLSAKFTAAQPAKVELLYQVAEPGKYIPLADPAFKSGWTTVEMKSTNGSWSVELPSEIQKQRRLVRYKVRSTSADAKSKFVPAADDPEPNRAYFVYDGIPGWKGAINPKGTGTASKQEIFFPARTMQKVQAYHVIARQKDVENATWYQQNGGKDYSYTGTFVYDGEVYDHVRFRARGGVWRFAMGKNMWKFDFPSGHPLAARDDYGKPYKSKWSKLNLRACIQQGDYGMRGEQGMFEAVGFRLFNLAGAEAPRTHWIQLRWVTGVEEQPPDQYQGDFWGLYLAIENEDGHFLKEHSLPDGSVFKMMGGMPQLSHAGTGLPTNGTDARAFFSKAMRSRQSESWWRDNFDLKRYYAYRSVLEAIHHYDVEGGKNWDVFFNPENHKWSILPWDIDLTWADHMYGGGSEPMYFTVLQVPSFQREYQNTLREIRDLLYNTEQTHALIDECAAIISDVQGAPSMVEADRMKWDFHPIMNSQYSMSDKAGKGRFYQASDTRDFAGMVKRMKEYVIRRGRWMDSALLKEKSLPETPKIEAPAKGPLRPAELLFHASDYIGPRPFASIQWRVGEFAPSSPAPSGNLKQGVYEITPIWLSAESTNQNFRIQIPASGLAPKHIYRLRARVKDQAGWSSHWSAPVEFTLSE